MRRPLCLALLLVTCGAFVGAGCGDELAAPPAGEVGHLQIPLSTVGDDGATYVLSNAIFDCYGPTSTTVVAPDDVGGGVFVDLALGDYSIVLRDGWQVKQLGTNGQLEPVAAELASKNPLEVRLLPGGDTAVARYEFLLGDGTRPLNLSFGVTGHTATLAGHMHVDADVGYDATGTRIENGFTGLTGQDLDYVARFAFTGTQRVDFTDGSKGRYYFGGATRLTFTGDPVGTLAGPLAREIGGNRMRILLRPLPGGNFISLVATVEDIHAEGLVGFTVGPVLVNGSFDAAGYPEIAPGQAQLLMTEFEGMTVQRYVQTPEHTLLMTEGMWATGDVQIQL
jgi:hypothetical protein